MNFVELFLGISLFAKLSMMVAFATFGLAAWYVGRPSERILLLMRPVSLAAIFATISSLFGGWIVVLQNTAATPDGHLPVASMALGLTESLTTGFVCFGLLGAAWLLVAMGVLRRTSVGPSQSLTSA